MSRPCPCTSKRPLERCCGPYLSGERLPETAEALMRSRFSAYALGKVDYLIATTAQEKRAELDRGELQRYCKGMSFVSLRILATERGGSEDSEGVVTFHASLQTQGRRVLHREVSRFVREDGHWMYVDGDTN